MGDELFTKASTELPAIIPIFPLSGVLLLPRGSLPLNIFEPRYLMMVKDAVNSHQIIGMIQPTDPYTDNLNPELYNTGCIGEITEFEETESNRALITLTGLCRFKIHRELPLDELLYRRAEVMYDSFTSDLIYDNSVSFDRDRLMSALKTFFEIRGISADWSAIDELGNEHLMTNLAMACPFGPSEKQALLECQLTKERSLMFQALLEMAAYERDGGDSRRPAQ